MGRSSLRTGFDVEAVGGRLETREGVLVLSVDLSDMRVYLSRDRSRFERDNE